MDKSDEYINMCKCARKIQYNKYADGFEEGDYVFDGKIVRIVGHDFLNVRSKYQNAPRQMYEFYMVESQPEINNDHLPYEIEMKTGKYVIERISHPIWLPRQDQLQELTSTPQLNTSGNQIKAFNLWYKYFDKILSGCSFEQIWLHYLMSIKYTSIWYESGWKDISNWSLTQLMIWTQCP